jgi:hypothetical protein
MRFPLALPLLVTGFACAPGSLVQSTSAPSTAPAPDAYACVRDRIKATGFNQTSYDTDELRITAQKYDETTRRADVTFRRMVDRLAIDVSPGAGGELSRITVEATTFAQRITQRGPTEEQERPSETARAAAQTILEKCGGEAARSDSLVPPT